MSTISTGANRHRAFVFLDQFLNDPHTEACTSLIFGRKKRLAQTTKSFSVHPRTLIRDGDAYSALALVAPVHSILYTNLDLPAFSGSFCRIVENVCEYLSTLHLLGRKLELSAIEAETDLSEKRDLLCSPTESRPD